jgi:hypothetical protein
MTTWGRFVFVSALLGAIACGSSAQRDNAPLDDGAHATPFSCDGPDAEPVAVAELKSAGGTSVGALDETYAYVDAGGWIQRVALNGSGPKLLAETRAGWRLIVDADDVYWGEDDWAGENARLARVSKHGGPSETLVGPTPNQFLPFPVTMVGGVLVFTWRGLNAAPHGVFRRDANGAISQLTQLNMASEGGVALRDGVVYFAHDDGIGAVPLGGGAAEVWLQETAPPGQMLVTGNGRVFVADADALYVSTQGFDCSNEGRISRVDWSTREITTLDDQVGCTSRLVLAARHLAWSLDPEFWPTPGYEHLPPAEQPSILALPRSGGDRIPVAFGVSALIGIAGGAVFFVSEKTLFRRCLDAGA